MAISVDWPAGVISVPKADTVLTGTDPISGREIRSYDTDAFHEALRDAEETAAGRAWPLTHLYNAASTLGGVTYAPQLILVNDYQVEFESVGTPWRVVFTSTNNNIADFSVVNDVSIQPGNSAGLIRVVETGVPQKGVALANFTFVMISETDHASPATGLTVTAQVSKDGGAFAAADNAPVEMSNGYYKLDLTANDMNADLVTLRFSATGADDAGATIVTAA